MRSFALAASLAVIAAAVLGGCISDDWGTGEDPWSVVLWSCGDTEFPMTNLVVVYDDGRLFHLMVWQGGHGPYERETAPALSDDEAMAVAEDVHSAGLIDLDVYRPLDDPEGRPFFRHAESEQLSSSTFRSLERSADRVGFSSLDDRYFGTDEETDYGHACGFRVGLRDGTDWHSTVLSPIESAGPQALRDYTTQLLLTHLEHVPHS